MTELTEQQQHLVELVQQRQQIVSNIADLSNKSNESRDLLLRIEGAIEYLNTIGVSLPQPVVTEETAEKEVVEESEEVSED